MKNLYFKTPYTHPCGWILHLNPPLTLEARQTSDHINMALWLNAFDNWCNLKLNALVFDC